MPGHRTALLSTVMTASVRWPASPGRMSCRSRARVTSSTASLPAGTRWPRWPRRCWAQRSARWKSPTTARMVSAVGCVCGLRRHVQHMAWSCCNRLTLKSHWLIRMVENQVKICVPVFEFGFFVVCCTRQTHLQSYCKMRRRGIHVWKGTFTVSNTLGTQWVIFSLLYLEHFTAANHWVYPFRTLRGGRAAVKVSSAVKSGFKMMQELGGWKRCSLACDA